MYTSEHTNRSGYAHNPGAVFKNFTRKNVMLKGQITAYSKAVRAGIIRTEDKVELHFSLSEWLSDCEPEVGMLVDFRRGPRQMTAIMVRHLTE